MTDAQQRINEIRARAESRATYASAIELSQVERDRADLLQHIAELTMERDAAITDAHQVGYGDGVEQYRKHIDAAYQDGQIAMRERCAKLAEEEAVIDGYVEEHQLDGFEIGATEAERCIAAQIRALQPEAKEK